MRKILNPLNKIDLNLKGNVKMCSESWHSRWDIMTNEKIFRSKMVYYFDRDGKIFETHNFEEHGGNCGIVYYKYNFKGELIERKEFTPAEKKGKGLSDVEEPLLIYDDDGEFELNSYRDITSKIIYFYNSKGNIVKELDYLEESMLPRKTYFDYDEKDNLISKRKFDYEGLRSRTISKFDNKGNLLNKKRLSPIKKTKRESVHFDETFKYDNQGRLIEKTELNILESEKKTYKYDDTIREIEVSTFEWWGYLNSGDPDYDITDKLKNIMIYKYSISDEVFEKVEFTSDGSFSNRTLYKYDNNGNIIEESNYGSDGNLRYKHIFIKTIYDFDNEGNWRKMYIIDHFSSFGINEYEREIEYY